MFEENKRAISDFHELVSRYTVEREEVEERRSLLAGILLVFVERASEYDKDVTFTTRHIGNKFVTILNNNAISDDIIVICLRLACRFVRERTIKTAGAYARQEVDILNYLGRLEPENDEEQLERDFVNYTLPFQMMRELQIKSDENLIDAATTVNLWTKTIQDKEDEVTKILKDLKSIKSDLNFTILSKGFHDLKVEKHKEKNKALLFMCFSGLAIILIPLFKIIFKFELNFTSESISITVYSLVIISVLLYYFRIAYQRYISINAQLVQIGVRIALLSFIEDYVEFVKQKDDGDGKSRKLEKFEAQIFAGIQPLTENVPNTFDGLEQVAKAIGEFRKNLN